jgi:hypothetical protein
VPFPSVAFDASSFFASLRSTGFVGVTPPPLPTLIFRENERQPIDDAHFIVARAASIPRGRISSASKPGYLREATLSISMSST